MMVRNEARIIRRALDSALHCVDAWCIVDTGSDDDTPAIIAQHLAGIPGMLHQIPFVDFGTSRTETVARARAFCLAHDIDYLLLLDADEWVEVKNPTWKSDLDGSPYLLLYDDAFSYRIMALIPARHEWRYVGRTHEYLESVDTTPPQRFFDGIVLHDVGDGGCKSHKFTRDAHWLDATLREHPDDARAWFYLGESHLNGRLDLWRALECYATRSRLGGFEEEAWYAGFRRGQCLELLPQPTGGLWPALAAWFEAWERRPWRAEPLHEIVRLGVTSGHPLLAAIVADHAIQAVVPRTERAHDILFVDRVRSGPGLYDWGSLAEYAVGVPDRARELAGVARADPMMASQLDRLDRNIAAFRAPPTPFDLVAAVEGVLGTCRWLRERGCNASCVAVADGLQRRPEVTAILADRSRSWQLDFDRSVCCYYLPEGRAVSRRLTLDLVRRRALPDAQRRAAMANRRFHVEPLSDSVLHATPLEIDRSALPPGYHPTNPSLALIPGTRQAAVVVRTVNYRLQPDGRYLTPGFVQTRNLIGILDDHGRVSHPREIVPDGPMPPDTGDIRGFEDLRLLAVPGAPTRFRAVANHAHPDGSGRRAMYLLDLVVDRDSARIVAALHLHGVRDHRHQKNWMPVQVGHELMLIYHCHPTVVVRPDPHDGRCEVVRISRPSAWCGDLRGGTPLVPVDGPDGTAYLALVHGLLDESPRRTYFHAWAGFDNRLRLRRISDPFLLRERQIEFAAGLVHRDNELLLTWGENDASAWFGRVPLDVALGALQGAIRG